MLLTKKTKFVFCQCWLYLSHTSSLKNTYFLYDGVTQLQRTGQCSHGRIQAVRPSCWGHRTSSKSIRCSAKMYVYILYIQGRGDPGEGAGNKTIPSDAAKGMRLLGTIAGAKVFNSTEIDRAFMAPTTPPRRHFKFHELLNQQQLKGFMSRPRADLVKAYAKVKGQEDKNMAMRKDPLMKKIEETKTKSLLLKYFISVYRNHNVELSAQQRLVLEKTLPKKLKADLYILVANTYGRIENDIALFNLPAINIDDDDDDDAELVDDDENGDILEAEE